MTIHANFVKELGFDFKVTV